MRYDYSMSEHKVDSQHFGSFLDSIVQIVMEVVHDLCSRVDKRDIFFGVEFFDVCSHLNTDCSSSDDDDLIRLLYLCTVVEKVL